MAEMTPAGSGGSIPVNEPARDGSLEIRGGIGGISFQFDELLGGAEKLDILADDLGSVEIDVRRMWEQLCFFPHEPSQVRMAALSVLGEARQGIRNVSAELQHISQQVRDTLRTYELAEAGAGLARALGIPGFRDFLDSCADFQITGLPNGNATELVTGNVPLMWTVLLGLSPAQLVTTTANDLAAGRHTSAVVLLIRSIANGAYPKLKPRPVSVEQHETVSINVDASLSGLLERARVIDERGEGYIEVIEVENAGQKAYIVVVPGTQTGSETGGDNPFDIAGIAEGLGYGSAEVNAAILAALRAAGAEQGSSVVAVGYSQGGVHAMNLAADRQFLDEFDMKYVLTAGSPVGGISPGPGISSLHLEHREDWVPGGDGIASPDTPNRVTVTLNRPVWTAANEDPGLGPGHKLSNYQDGARLVAASDDPSLRESTAVVAGVLGTGGAATATRFALTRARTSEPPAAPAPPAPAGPVPAPRPQQPPRPSSR